MGCLRAMEKYHTLNIPDIAFVRAAFKDQTELMVFLAERNDISRDILRKAVAVAVSQGTKKTRIPQRKTQP